MHQTDFSLDSTMPFSRTKTISILSVVAILLIASMLLVTHFSPGSEANARSQLLRLVPADATAVIFIDLRSEEHTSELQSHSDLVCRLLLEKKKKKKQIARVESKVERPAIASASRQMTRE